MTPSSSGRRKLGGAFTGATPFDGLRVLAPGEPNAPAPTPPLRSVPVNNGPDQDTDQVDDTAEPAPDEHVAAAVADDAPGTVDDRGSAAAAQPDAARVDDGADTPTPAVRPKMSSTAKRAPRARAVSGDSAASPAASSGAANQSATKLVPVNIDVSVHNQLRQFAARVELPFSVICPSGHRSRRRRTRRGLEVQPDSHERGHVPDGRPPDPEPPHRAVRPNSAAPHRRRRRSTRRADPRLGCTVEVGIGQRGAAPVRDGGGQLTPGSPRRLTCADLPASWLHAWTVGSMSPHAVVGGRPGQAMRIGRIGGRSERQRAMRGHRHAGGVGPHQAAPRSGFLRCFVPPR